MSIKLFVAEIEKLSRLQQNRNTAWTEIEDSLNRLKKYCPDSLDPPIRQQDITNLHCTFLNLINENRSKLVISLCETMKSMIVKLKNKFEPISRYVFPSCLTKVSSGISTISEAMSDICIFTVENVVSVKTVPYILKSIEKRSDKEAKTAIECLKIVVETWPNVAIYKNQDEIIISLSKAVSSFSSDVRSTSNSIISIWCTRFPDLKEPFLSLLQCSFNRLINKLPANARFGLLRNDNQTLTSTTTSTTTRIPTPRLTSPEMRKTSPVIRSNTPSIRSPLLSKKPVSSTSTSTSTTRLLSSTSLPSYYHNSILYSLNQQVQCNLHNGVFEGTIKYIGSPIMDKKDVYFGILFTKNTGSQFNGIINNTRLFDCKPGYGALLLPSYVVIKNEPLSPNHKTTKYNLPSPALSKSSSFQTSTPSSPHLSRSATIPSQLTSPSVKLSNSISHSPSEESLSIEDCIAAHKLLIFRSIESLRGELSLVEEFESVKKDPEAIKAYKRDIQSILDKRQQESTDFMSKLARLTI